MSRLLTGHRGAGRVGLRHVTRGSARGTSRHAVFATPAERSLRRQLARVRKENRRMTAALHSANINWLHVVEQAKDLMDAIHRPIYRNPWS